MRNEVYGTVFTHFEAGKCARGGRAGERVRAPSIGLDADLALR